MIASIRGKITEVGNRAVIVEIGGLGYKVHTTDDVLHSLKLNSETFLWTHLAVREDAEDLYGFLERKERDLFELLITISGIGPKTALNVLSVVSGDALARAVRAGSTAHLIKISGIGRKTAEKIVLELRDRLGAFVDEVDGAKTSNDSDVIEALKTLGYDLSAARDALKQIDSNISDTGDKVKAALKILGR